MQQLGCQSQTIPQGLVNLGNHSAISRMGMGLLHRAGQGLEVERGREQQVLYIFIVLFNPHNSCIFMSIYSGGTEAQ